MILLVGESASGKSTIEKELVKFGYNKVVSYTTRPPREGEVDGVDYHFISEDDFITLNNCDFFAETAEYRGWLYGSAVKDCTYDKIAVVTPHGLRQLQRNKELDIRSFYINVNRRNRLIKILQRGDDIEEAYRRSVSDVGMFDGIEDEVDYVINNYNYEKTPTELADKIMKLIKAGDSE